MAMTNRDTFSIPGTSNEPMSALRIDLQDGIEQDYCVINLAVVLYMFQYENTYRYMYIFVYVYI